MLSRSNGNGNGLGASVRRWVFTAIFVVVTFVVASSCANRIESTDEEAERAAIAAERAEVKSLAESVKQQNLCGVLAYLVQRSNASLPSIEYYQDHPGELRRAQEANQETLKLLNCPPIVPPPAITATPEERYTPRDSHEHAHKPSDSHTGE